MDEIDKTADNTSDDQPIVHQFGKLMVGSIAAFGANKLAEKLYDGAVRAYRSRKSS